MLGPAQHLGVQPQEAGNGQANSLHLELALCSPQAMPGAA